MDVLRKVKMFDRKAKRLEESKVTTTWIETAESVSYRYRYNIDRTLTVSVELSNCNWSNLLYFWQIEQVEVIEDKRPVLHRVVNSFLNQFFPEGYPHSVNEGYLRYSSFRAVQHFSSAALSVLSTQSLLFAAGLRQSPAQATAISWILKDGMQHVGKLICSNLGARMDSEPKRWRILADVLYDIGAGLEILSPMWPNLFLEVAGLGNFAKGMAVVAARATRLPIYSSFAKEGNLGDLFAKGEAMSTLFNVLGIGAGVFLASTTCSSTQGKLIAGPLLSAIHVCCVIEEMRAAPVNTLNGQRTALIVADFVKRGKVSSPADIRYREDLLFPGRIVEDAGNVVIGRSLHKVMKPSAMVEWAGERFVLSMGRKWTDMILDVNATGEDALRGWLVAAYANDKDFDFKNAYDKMNSVFKPFLMELKVKGWHTQQFLDGTGSRFSFKPSV